MTLTKTFYHKHKSDELLIEFTIDSFEEDDDYELDFNSINVISCMNEECHEEVNLDNIQEIIEDWCDKNYKRLIKEIKSEF